MKKQDFMTMVVSIDESMREILSLDELYTDLAASRPATEAEADSVKEQAKFAKERILRLSLHVKNLLRKAEAQEKV
jgi:hypothetical protein